MVNSFVRKQDLDSEMTVVRNEFEMGENNPGGVLFQRMQQLAYPWHNYGNPIIGQRADIEKVPIEQAAGLLPHVVSAGQRGADHRRALRRGTRGRARRQALRPVAQAHARAARLLYRGADAGRRAPRAPGARRRQPDRLHAVSRARGQPSRLPGDRLARQHPRRCARRPAAPRHRAERARLAGLGRGARHARSGLYVLRRLPRARWQARATRASG